MALEIDQRVSRQALAIDRITERVTHGFSGLSYGNDVEHVVIGVILMESNRFHPTRPLKYRRRFRFRDILTREAVELTNVIEYEVALDYDSAQAMSVKEFERFAAARLLESVELIRRNRAKYPLFDVEAFERDFAVYVSATETA